MSKPKTPKVERFQFMLDPVLHIRLKQKAAELRLSASKLLGVALAEYLRRNA